MPDDTHVPEESTAGNDELQQEDTQLAAEQSEGQEDEQDEGQDDGQQDGQSENQDAERAGTAHEGDTPQDPPKH